MNVLFLTPPFKNMKLSRTSRSPAVTKNGTLYYPFWLACAVGVLKATSDFNCKLIDAPAKGLSTGTVLERAKEFSPYLVVIDTTTPSILKDIRVARPLKEKLGDAFITLAGTHSSASPDETMKLGKGIDAVARGEYDYTIGDLAYALRDEADLNSVAGLSYREGNEIMHYPERPLIDDLDKIPFVSQVYKRHVRRLIWR